MRLVDTMSLRERAITVMATLVRKHGYQKCRLVDVAKELNISHAALYKHFKNRQELLDAVNNRWLAEFNGELLDIVNGPGTATEQIKRWFLTLYSKRRTKVNDDVSPYEIFLDASQHNRFIAQADTKERWRQLELLTAKAIRQNEININHETAVRLLFAATEFYIHPVFIFTHAQQDYTKDLGELLDIILKGMR